jgi:hypothetical protein
MEGDATASAALLAAWHGEHYGVVKAGEQTRLAARRFSAETGGAIRGGRAHRR